MWQKNKMRYKVSNFLSIFYLGQVSLRDKEATILIHDNRSHVK